MSNIVMVAGWLMQAAGYSERFQIITKVFLDPFIDDF